MTHFKRRIIVLICWLLVSGIIESICSVMEAELKVHLIFLLLGTFSYILSYDLF